jgi:hypothetical protein
VGEDERHGVLRCTVRRHYERCGSKNARGETHLSLCTTFLLLAFMTLVVSVDIVHCQCCCFVVDVVVDGVLSAVWVLRQRGSTSFKLKLVLHATKQNTPTKHTNKMSTDAASSDDALTTTNTTNSSSDDGSSGITYAGQVSLPRLPIPSLEDTMARFPAAVCALLSSSHDSDDGSSSPFDIHGVNTKEMEECLASIHNFLETDGPLLQKMLVEYERKGREDGTLGSFVEEFWSDAYLAPDSSVVMNLNPFFVLEVSGLFFV